MLGMTQGELAQMAGISTTGLNNIERGMSDPKASTLTAIESALRNAGIELVDDNERLGVTVKRGVMAKDSR